MRCVIIGILLLIYYYRCITVAEKLKFKDCMFNPDVNPGIRFFSNLSLAILSSDTIPNLAMLEGWKMMVLQISFFAFMMFLTLQLFYEGFTLFALLLRIIILSAVFGFIHIHTMSAAIYGFLYRWERFK